MQNFLAGLAWQGETCRTLGLTYTFTGGRVSQAGQDLGPAADQAAADALVRGDAMGRVLAALTPEARTALLGLARARHKKRGSHYQVLGRGRLQTGAPLADDAALVIYRAVEDGALWARPVGEFEDGRFEIDPGFSADKP